LKGLFKCSKKIDSSVKFVDFFVHDILDYSMLNKKQENFLRDLVIVDIRTAIKEILEIQEDKALMKEVHVRTLYKNF
jgi:hypothetical protein